MVKRAVDLVISTIALVVAAPLIGVVATAIRIADGKPILFRQQRPGLNGTPFNVLKFRTMRPLPSSTVAGASDSDRLTKLGIFLRATSIDELPQLLNVLRGDMSIVGPRPLLMDYLPRYTVEQARRHCVRPGLTGWAQVNGRNAITWEDKFRLDVWYVDNQTLWLDMRIIAMTVITALRREGINQKGRATVEPFGGSRG
jgi:sugar transferase EpsL